MRLAVPLTRTGSFSPHFGGSARFEVFELDRRRVLRRMVVVPRASTPCEWPRLLRAAGVDVLLARGIGRTALNRLANHAIDVLPGVRAGLPEELVAAWLAGDLKPGQPVCDRTGPYRPAPATAGGGSVPLPRRTADHAGVGT